MMDEDVGSWLEMAKYDIGTAEDLMKSGRYLYVMFACQQAIEKTLKALIVHKKNVFPPKTHDLIALAKAAEIPLDAGKKEFLKKMAYYYIETRYPGESAKIIKEVNDYLAELYFKKSKEMIAWLEQNLQ